LRHRFDKVVRQTAFLKSKHERPEEISFFRPLHTVINVSDEAFIRMCIVQGLANNLPLVPSRDAKMYSRLMKVVTRERNNPKACSEAQAEVERQYTLEAKQNIMPADSDDEVEVFKPCCSSV